MISYDIQPIVHVQYCGCEVRDSWLVINIVFSDYTDRPTRNTWAETTVFINLIGKKPILIARNPVSPVLILYSEFLIEPAFAGKYLNKLVQHVARILFL